MQAAWRVPGHEAGESLAAAPERPSREPFRVSLGTFLAIALLCLWAPRGAASEVAASPPQGPSPKAPSAVPSTAELSGDGFDAGRWQAAGPAGVASPVALAVDAERADHLYLATRDGLYMSRDGGRTWVVTALPGLVAFAPHPGEPATLFAVTATDDGRLRLWRSDDRGWSWRPGGGAEPPAGHHRPRPPAVSLALDPSRPDRLWLGAVFAARPEEDRGLPVTRLWASRDGGESLQPLSLPAAGEADTGERPEPTLALAALEDGTLYAASRAGLHRLIPGAEGWEPAGDGLYGPPDKGPPGAVRHLASAGADRRVLYATVEAPPGDGPAEPRRVYRSADGGARWRPFGIHLPAGPICDLVPRPGRRSEILVAVTGAGVFSSRGDAWAEVTPGLPAAAEPAFLAVAPGRREVLWAVTTGGDLYRRGSPPPGCSEDEETLCLAGRFRVDVAPAAASHSVGRAHAVPLTREAGWFWFSHPEEPEVAVRASAGAGRPTGGPGVWTVYASSLADRPFELRVYDTVSGLGESLQSGGDGDGGATLVATFPTGDTESSGGDVWFAALPEGGCGGDSIDLCLQQGRFEVAVDWRDAEGAGGAAVGDRLTEAAGWFRFLHPGEPELMVKVVDGRQANGHWQVAFASLGDLGFELTVTDRRSGDSVVYEVGPGSPSSHRDATALPDTAPGGPPWSHPETAPPGPGSIPPGVDSAAGSGDTGTPWPPT